MTDANRPSIEDSSAATEMEPSLRPAVPDPGVDFGDDDLDTTDQPGERAGYDVDAVSGDTDAVRPG